MKKLDLKRTILFLVFCLGLRSLLVFFAITLRKDKRIKILSGITLIPALGFLYLHFTDGRKNAEEAGGVTWWDKVRIIHGFLYLAFSVCSFLGIEEAWIFLAVDVILGFLFFLMYRILNINFLNLFVTA